MIKGGIVGGTGYAGIELLRLLINHPEISLEVITSRRNNGMAVDELFPSFRGHVDLIFTKPDIDLLSSCDVVFFATPHATAMALVPELIDRSVMVIDLSADFRIKDVTLWEKWYGTLHTCPYLVAQAVYGLPEVNRELIKSAQLISVPGCYPTAIQLGFLPLLKNNIIDPMNLIADTKSGISGAGRKAAIHTLLAESSENVRAYGLSGHRHLPEIEQGLSLAAKQKVSLTFIPHLMPMIRGIYATLYGRLKYDVNLQSLFEQYYAHEPFVDILPSGCYPETSSVSGTNTCRISVHKPREDGDTVVVLSAIDNLIKGASGQAVQNMNIMFGFGETTAIGHIAILP
ncbi:MAG: N-acetyl-gamma-glutamyl-phosphate reductase [Piscirickettsiaceae bacterium]|nr:N-acetyl-gamma-glutamyl-phosphate reductase [Piscirickettsiaceae bacterium]